MTKKRRTRQFPAEYQVGFLARLDKRTEIAQRLQDNYQVIANDLGGAPELTHVKSSLVERFVFLEAVLAKLENDMASIQPKAKSSEPVDLGKWIQAVNSLTGLAKALGIERKLHSRPWAAAMNGHSAADNHTAEANDGD